MLHDGEVPSPETMAPLQQLTQVQYTDEAGLAEALPGAEVLFAYHFTSKVLPGAWHAADSLRWLHVAAAGVDPFMTEEVRAAEVVVTNSRGVFDGAIAEYVLGQVLAFAKDLPGSWRRQQSQLWEHRESERVSGTRALVIGTGPIGRTIARLLRAAGLQVRGSGRRARENDPDFTTVRAQEDLPTELARADWVVLAAPLTDATRGMIDTDALAAMRSSARLINVGRGELVRTDDLVAALDNEVIAGAALDVMDPEPLPPGHPLWELPTALITPHNSGDFVGWRQALVELFAENLARWQAGEQLENIVDKNMGYVPGS